MAERIDAHHHLWRYSHEEYGWIASGMNVLRRDFLPEDLDDELRAAGIDGSIAVQARQSVEETRWLLELAEQRETIRGVVGWLPLTSPDVGPLLKEFGTHRKLKGVRHVLQDEPDDRFMLREDFNAGVESLLEAGLVYDILIHERQLPEAIELVKRHPGQIFVLDHLAKPLIRERTLEPWRTNLKRLADSGDVFCKLSGLVTEADWATWTLDDLRPYMDAAMEAFGAERLMAGSDWPVCLLASGYARWWSAIEEWMRDMSSGAQEQIMGVTAQRVYRLSSA